MFERFTDRARRVVVLAQDEARSMRHNYIDTEHFLLALVAEGEGVAGRALTKLGVDADQVRARILEVVGEGPEDIVLGGHIPFTPRAKKVLELSLREALQLGHSYIGTEHLLLGMVREGEGVGVQVLEHLGVDLLEVRRAVMGLLVEYGNVDLDNVAGEGEMLTPNERAVVQMAADLWDQICVTVPEGPTRDQDLNELIAPIHLIQRYFMGQAATRAYPGRYRSLGKSLRGQA